jgi:hypothetical protein
MNIIVLTILMAVLLTIFIGTYVLNNRTKAPEMDVDLAGCKGCHNITCGHHDSHKQGGNK